MAQVLLAKELQVIRGARTILNIPHLAVRTGEVMAIIGPNGAGKSTLMQVLSYLIKPTKGEVLFHGEPCRKGKSLLSARRRMATVFQDSFCRGLSGGEAQRVSLARAFAVEPEVLFLDEPFTSLDAPTKVRLMDELEQVIKNTKVTTLFVTHDADGIPFYVDRLLVLEQGLIDQEADPLQMLKNPATPFVKAFFRHFLTGSSLADLFEQNADKYQQGKGAGDRNHLPFL